MGVVELPWLIGGLVLGGGVAAAAMKAQMQVPSASDLNQGVELSRKLDGDYPREVAVGLFATGGSGAYDCVAGADNKFLYRVTILSDYEITGFRELWLDGEKMRLSGDPLQGWVDVLGRYQKSGDDVTPGPAIRLRVMRGTENQALEPVLANAAPRDRNGDLELGPTDRFAGMAYAILRFEHNQEAFQGGEPKAFFVGEGAPVHDPRDPNSDPHDPASWSRTSSARFNAALVTAQAMRGWRRGGDVIVGAEGLHTFDIPEGRLAEAADICDEDRVTPKGVEPRYRVGGMITMDKDSGVRPGLEALFAAMNGDLVEDGGQFIILPGAARTPVAHYDLQSMGGRCLSFDPYGGSTQRKNRCSCTFVDPEASYEAQPLPVYAPQAYLDADEGRPNTLTVGLDFVPFRYQAAAIQKSLLDRQRLVATATFNLPLIAKELQPGDWLTITDEISGQNAAVWEVLNHQRVTNEEEGARVVIDCRAIDVTPYEFSASDAEGAIGVITAPPERIYPDPGVPVLTLTPIYIEGGQAKEPAIRVDALIPESPLETHIDFEWRQKSAPEVLFSRSLEKARGGFVIREGVVPGEVFQVRARLSAPTRKGHWSAWREETAPSEYVVPDAALPSQRLDEARQAINAALGNASETFAEAMTDVAGAAGSNAIPSLRTWLRDPLLNSLDGWRAKGKGFTQLVIGAPNGIQAFWDFSNDHAGSSRYLLWPVTQRVSPSRHVQAACDVSVTGVVDSVVLQAVWLDETGARISTSEIASGNTGRIEGVVRAPDQSHSVEIRTKPEISGAGAGAFSISKPQAAFALPGQETADPFAAPGDELIARIESLERVNAGQAQFQRNLLVENRTGRAFARDVFLARSDADSSLGLINLRTDVEFKRISDKVDELPDDVYSQAAADLKFLAVADLEQSYATIDLTANAQFSGLEKRVDEAGEELTSLADAQLSFVTRTEQSSALSGIRSYVSSSIANGTSEVVWRSSRPNPSSYKRGDIWVDSDDKKWHVHNGSDWIYSIDESAVTTANANQTIFTQSSLESALSGFQWENVAYFGGLPAGVTSWSEAYSGLNNRVSATHGFELNANGKIARMVAHSDQARSDISFEFDAFRIWSGSSDIAPFSVVDGRVEITNATIDGANIKELSVGTLQIRDNAISQTASASERYNDPIVSIVSNGGSVFIVASIYFRALGVASDVHAIERNIAGRGWTEVKVTSGNPGNSLCYAVVDQPGWRGQTIQYRVTSPSQTWVKELSLLQIVK